MPVDSAGRVPAFLSSFVGRSRELGQLRRLLERGDPRLLTLVGPGGSGKTRLAARIAQVSAARYEDGLCWVSLDGLNDPAQVPQAVVAALGLVEASPAPIELLVDALRRRQLLLVLDNCEHLLDACAQLVAALLTNAPDLRLLATSRERLNVDGERVWPVPGLSVPLPETPISARDDGAATGPLLAYDSVRLFVERATAAQPAFQLEKETESAVRRICRQLDGLPLAVELAAARVRALGLADIATQLGERLDLLTGGPRTAPDRQRTLRATFDWSHDLLEPGEKRIFRRLGVFRGPFSLSGVQAVGGLAAGESDASMPAEAILEALTGLVEKSLVVREAAGDGRTVYRLLNMIRHYAEEKLVEAGEADAVREAHLMHYADLAIVAEPGLKGPEQRFWLEKLMLSGDNLRAALGWAISRAKEDETGRYRLTAQRMTNALFWFWNAADRFGEGRDWLERTLSLFAPQGAVRPVHLAVAEGLRAAGTMAWLLGDMSAAAERLQESLAQCQRLEDEMNVAQAMMMLGRVYLYQGQAADALKMFEPSLDIFREHDALFEQGLTLGGLSAGLAMIGDYDAAYSAAVECRDVFAVVGDPFFTGMALGDLGWAAYHKGRIAVAVGHLEEALALRRRVDSSWQTAQALVYLAEIYRYQGKAAQATDYLEEARALAEDIGAGGWLAHSARHLGLLAIEDARWEEAATYLLDSLRRSARLENTASMVMAVEALALVAVAAEERGLAGLLQGAIEAQRARLGPPRTPAERGDLARLRERLTPLEDDEAFVAGQAAGKLLPLPEAGRRAASLIGLFAARPAAAPQVPHRLRISALGPVDVYVDGRRLVAADWGYAKPKELLFYLVEHQALTKEAIGLVFWPDASPDQLRRNFRTTLYQLRQALGQKEWVQYENGRYRFNWEMDIWYDVDEFEQRIAQAEEMSGREQIVEALSAAVELYRGDFLADVTLDEWAVTRRESLRQRYLAAQLRRAGLLYALGRLQESTAVYRELLADDDLLEPAYRGLMRGYVDMGRTAEALRVYRELETRLAEELGIAPDDETRVLARRLRDRS